MPASSGTWLKCNFDTGASITAVPKKYHENLQEKSNSFAASGELIRNYGPVGVVGYDVGGVKRSINGNATDVHKVLVSVGQLHAKGHCTWMFKGGGMIMPLDQGPPSVQGDGADLRESDEQARRQGPH